MSPIKGKETKKPIFNLKLKGPELPGINSGNNHYKRIRARKKPTGFCRYEISEDVECGKPLRGKNRHKRLYCHLHKDAAKQDNRNKSREYNREYSKHHSQPGTFWIKNNIVFDKKGNPIFKRPKVKNYGKSGFNNQNLSSTPFKVITNPPGPYRVCDECGSRLIEYDLKHDETRCKSCGLVLAGPYGSNWNYPEPVYNKTDYKLFLSEIDIMQTDNTKKAMVSDH